MTSLDILVHEAIEFIEKRFPPTPWQGAAALLLKNGEFLISTSPRVESESVSLCHETGAICEAYKRDQSVIASVCVSRGEDLKYHILSPCGVCQERLYSWGGDVTVGVPDETDSTKCNWIKLSQASPYYWRKPFLKK